MLSFSFKNLFYQLVKKGNNNLAKVPNWKLNDLNYTKAHFSPNQKSDCNQRKRHLKNGLADHIAINILNAAINDNKAKKSNIVCDHSSYHKFILVSWGKIVHEEVQKG